jgi:hypothetical protein
MRHTKGKSPMTGCCAPTGRKTEANKAMLPLTHSAAIMIASHCMGYPTIKKVCTIFFLYQRVLLIAFVPDQTLAD